MPLCGVGRRDLADVGVAGQPPERDPEGAVRRRTRWRRRCCPWRTPTCRPRTGRCRRRRGRGRRRRARRWQDHAGVDSAEDEGRQRERRQAERCGVGDVSAAVRVAGSGEVGASRSGLRESEPWDLLCRRWDGLWPTLGTAPCPGQGSRRRGAPNGALNRRCGGRHTAPSGAFGATNGPSRCGPVPRVVAAPVDVERPRGVQPHHGAGDVRGQAGAGQQRDADHGGEGERAR